MHRVVATFQPFNAIFSYHTEVMNLSSLLSDPSRDCNGDAATVELRSQRKHSIYHLKLDPKRLETRRVRENNLKKLCSRVTSGCNPFQDVNLFDAAEPELSVRAGHQSHH